MMKKKTLCCRLKERELYNSESYYILLVAVITFLYMLFHKWGQVFYEYGLVIPCMLFLGIQQERKSLHNSKKIFLLPGAMVAWFLFLQAKRSFEGADVDNIGLFLSVYLFAFPLATLLQDGDKKKAIKIFANTYISAATMLSVAGLLLVLDCVPASLSKYVFWNGGRLAVFWHANIVACYLMIGIVFCTTYLEHFKTIWKKIILVILLVLMVVMLALTNCRTAIILTGVFFGATLFFLMIRRGRLWFIPGVLTVLAVTAVFCEGAVQRYQANYDFLITKYTQQYSEQVMSDSSDDVATETGLSIIESEKTVSTTEAQSEELVGICPKTEEEDYEEGYYEKDYYKEKISAGIQEESLPIKVDPNTGEVSLVTDSPQGTLADDLGTLNSRTYIWSAAAFAIRETPSILCWGIHDPGWYVSFYSSTPVGHMHNAWLQCLVGMGLVGFLLAMLFTVITVWNCVVILTKHYQDIWKRNVALLALCLLVASVLEPYLFYTTINYHLIDFSFFLCAGYLVHWQEKENQQIRDFICNRLSFWKK